VPRVSCPEHGVRQVQIPWATVEYIAADRKKTSLDAYYLSLTKRQLAGIQATAMDMWDPFIAATVYHVPRGHDKIVFDRYDIMANMNKAVTKFAGGSIAGQGFHGRSMLLEAGRSKKFSESADQEETLIISRDFGRFR
jgi:transposase